MTRRERLASLAGSRGLGAVPRRLASARAHFSERARELEDAIDERLAEGRSRLTALATRLDPHSHQRRVLERRRSAAEGQKKREGQVPFRDARLGR